MSYFQDQLEGWFDGGREWYLKNYDGKWDYDVQGMPADFDPFFFWAETGMDDDPNQANDMVDGNGDMIEIKEE